MVSYLLNMLNMKNFLIISLLFVLKSNGIASATVKKSTDTLSIIAVGDVLLARAGIEGKIKLFGEEYPFEKIVNLLKLTDIRFCNLESSLSERGKPVNKKWQLRGSPKRVDSLKYAGFNLVNLANNHTMDFGEEALLDTIKILNENNIHSIGAGKNINEASKGVVISKKGIKIGFLGYSAFFSTSCVATEKRGGIATIWPRKLIRESIKKIKADSDIVMVSFHWGEEKSYNFNKTQEYLAKLAIDSGADIVIGHHPHVIQGIQLYKDKPIIYSLGNFVFMPPKDEQNETIIVEFKIVSKGIDEILIYPVYINNGQPALASRMKSEKILNKLNELCLQKKTKLIVDKHYRYASMVLRKIYDRKNK